MKKEASKISLNYVTLKTTKSRIDKGLLAVPVSLIDIFPKTKNKIYLVDESENVEAKSFTPYNSSSRECRIGGLKKFYDKYNVQNGDELVIQVLDEDKFRLLPEKYFQNLFISSIEEFEKSEDEIAADEKLNIISRISNTDKSQILKNEFVRLSKTQIQRRISKIIERVEVKENVPISLRKVLASIYLGKCQVSDFTFLMKNGNAFFEIHHIDPSKGNHFKNLLVVSANVHRQFTYANVEQNFDNDGWLRKVKFNDESYNVFQAIDNLPNIFEKEVHI
ncbi:MAG: HNH endonuclease signature motif containing protein [Flavobacterium sp.]|nr:HNH endonuclease signature motif containing protein [Flavobacterium sp.]